MATKPPPDLDAVEGAQEEGTDGETNADVADFLSESTYFETVGVGVGRTESYYIVLALKQLGSKPGISKVRFFGKFFGIHGYVIVRRLFSNKFKEKIKKKFESLSQWMTV